MNPFIPSSPSSPVLTGSTGNEPGRGTESHVFILQNITRALLSSPQGESGDPLSSQPWGLQRNLTGAQNPALMAVSNSKIADGGPPKRHPGLPGVTVSAAVTSWTGGLKKNPAIVPNIPLSLTTSPRCLSTTDTGKWCQSTVLDNQEPAQRWDGHCSGIQGSF